MRASARTLTRRFARAPTRATIALLILGLASESRADDPRARASELAEIAKRRLADGTDYASAADLFLEAYELTKELSYLINTAVTARKAAQPHHAVLMYRRCLAEGGTALTDDLAKQIRGDIDAITRESVQISIRTAGEPAEITLHRRVAGTASLASPLIVLLSADSVRPQTLTASREGFAATTRDVPDLRAGAVIEIELEPRRDEGTLIIASVPPRATITTLGATGIAPVVFVVKPGDYDITAALPGYDPAHDAVSLRLGETRTLTLHLQETRRPWWARHKTKVYAGGALLVAAGVAFGAYKLFEPDYGHKINFP